MNLSKQSLAAAFLGVAWLLSGPANAQQQTQSGVQQPAASPNISDQKLNAAAAAMLRRRVESGCGLSCDTLGWLIESQWGTSARVPIRSGKAVRKGGIRLFFHLILVGSTPRPGWAFSVGAEFGVGAEFRPEPILQ